MSPKKDWSHPFTGRETEPKQTLAVTKEYALNEFGFLY